MLRKNRKNGIIKNYFKEPFNELDEKSCIKIFGTNEFKKIDTDRFVGLLEYPDLVFRMDKKKKKIIISLCYILSDAFPNRRRSSILCANLDEFLNILNFEYWTVLVD